MASWIAIAFTLVSARVFVAADNPPPRRYAEKAKDVEASGAEFVPQFHTFQYPPNSVFPPQPDLAALQQTHVLGGIHRFQSPRFSPGPLGAPILGQNNIFHATSNQIQQLIPARGQVFNHNQPRLPLNQQPRVVTPQQQGIRGANVRFPQQSFQAPPPPPFVNPPPQVNHFGHQQQQQQQQQNGFNPFAQPRPVPSTTQAPVINPLPLQQSSFRESGSFYNDANKNFPPNPPHNFPPNAQQNFPPQSFPTHPPFPNSFPPQNQYTFPNFNHLGGSSRKPQSTYPTEDPNVIFQKSHEQHKYLLQGDIFDKNEATQSPKPTTHENYYTSTSVQPETPSPIVKEIRINLDEHTTTREAAQTPSPAVKEIRINLNENTTPARPSTPQLFIKESRQKLYQEIEEQQLQNDKKEKTRKKSSKREKSQEDVINEQIHKLLQSHNLEIIDKDTESTSESQELQFSKLSETLKDKYNYNVQLLNGASILRESKKKKTTPRPRVAVTTTLPPLPDLPEHIKKEYDVKLVSRDELFKQFRINADGKNGEFPGNKFGNNTIFLSNGQQLEIVKLDKDGVAKKTPIGRRTTRKPVPSTSTTTTKPPKLLFEELAKGAIPPGADYELIRQNENGEIEKVTDVSNAKKVTFVLLEEQPDGSIKVQGVKGNANHETSDKDTINSLIRKINDGSLKLPPSQKTKSSSIFTNEVVPRNSGPSTVKSFVTLPPISTAARTDRYRSTLPFTSSTEQEYSTRFALDTGATELPTFPPSSFVSTTPRRIKTKSRVTFLPTLASEDSAVTSAFSSQRIRPTSSPIYLPRTSQTPRKTPKRGYSKLSSKYEDQSYPRASDITTLRSVEYSDGDAYATPLDVVAEESSIESTRPLTDVLKERGLNEMAKFLDQSGLDTILNETGPYTIFIPTDRAFRALEAQLGGTDRAEDKFRENPRLLSGLLLHHVVPGSFRVEDLQDEMTGVSLAGTQLRVNAYEDKKPGGRRIITINGAKVSNDLRDIPVPEGLAHAVDRVLFPLPVGDILQTLRGDRERRFTKFIKSLEAAGVTEMLTGSKTYTVFAPTDSAFSALTDAELDQLLTRKEAAKTIALSHIVPGTLYSAGMNYFQIKESMERGQKITIQKELGKIKANSAQIVTANIPATNGVIHIVETLL